MGSAMHFVWLIHCYSAEVTLEIGTGNVLLVIRLGEHFEPFRMSSVMKDWLSLSHICIMVEFGCEFGCEEANQVNPSPRR